MSDLAERAANPDQDLDAAIEQARAALSAVVRVPEPSGGPRQAAQARALLASLLYQRLTRAAARLDHDDPAAVSAVRADRNEAIAISSALLYELPSGGPAWRDVALMVGRLSYDRYRDAWPGAARPDPDDLDAACDLLMRGVRSDESDERTAMYLFLALRDRRRLLATRTDSDALVTWGRRLLTFPEAGGLGRGSLHNMLEAEILTRAESRGRAAAWWIPRQRLAACRYRDRGLHRSEHGAGSRNADRAGELHEARARLGERGEHRA
jgi:hypothetical protein